MTDEKMSIQERAKLDVEQTLDQLRWAFDVTLGEFVAYQKLCGVIGYNIVADEDEMFKRFCAERHAWFKPTPEQLQRELQLRAMQDPEIHEAMHDLQDKLHDDH